MLTLEQLDSQTQLAPPLVRELPADLETPVSVYLRLAGDGPSFLLESVSGGEQVARYSFIGIHPRRAFVVRGRAVERHAASGVTEEEIPPGEDPLDVLRAALADNPPAVAPGMPRLVGGLVGYLSYETIRFFEPRLALEPSPDLPDAIFLQADTIVAFDHAFGRLLLIANPYPNGDPAKAHAEAEARLDEIERRLQRPLTRQPNPGAEAAHAEIGSNMTREQYCDAVRAAKEYIAAGDIFQIVISQRFSRETTAAPFDIYRALRRLNPSPYMFFFDFEGLIPGEPLHLIGASPEMHVRLDGRKAAIRPIAGTRPRGGDPAEDIALEKELLADPKECAEHVMLIDLARNDLGRVCEYGTVQTSDLMGIERYSHVMHIVSHVDGALRPQYDGFDLMRATFPAGTVSGAPKIRAMEIIAELEGQPRGIYAGAVGYFSYDGSLDTCIAIRTLMMRGQTIIVQAGAGLVADSEPEREYQESVNKARALFAAVETAEHAAVRVVGSEEEAAQ